MDNPPGGGLVKDRGHIPELFQGRFLILFLDRLADFFNGRLDEGTHREISHRPFDILALAFNLGEVSPLRDVPFFGSALGRFSHSGGGV